MAKASKIRVFYSWQTDLSEKTNLNAIREALKTAVKKIEVARPAVEIVVLDEATRDISGSPNIAFKILEKIEDADVMVVDITTVTPADATRPCPNPNVSYELGYAVAQLGWERVILLFNVAFGDFPKDLPFDFAQHRVTPYELAESAHQSSRDVLTKVLEQAVTEVIDKKPKRPAELRGLSAGKD